jgi:hypothetical protein
VCGGDLRVALLQLDAGNNQFPLFRSQALQRTFVPLNRLAPDRFVEGGRRSVRMFVVFFNPCRRRIPAYPPNLVSYPVDECLTEIRLERPFVPGLEVVQMPESLRERFLHEILRVTQVSRPSRQTSTSPPPQGRYVPANQVIQRLRVALPGATQQVRR